MMALLNTSSFVQGTFTPKVHAHVGRTMDFTQGPSAHLRILATGVSVGTILDESESLASFTAVT